MSNQMRGKWDESVLKVKTKYWSMYKGRNFVKLVLNKFKSFNNVVCGYLCKHFDPRSGPDTLMIFLKEVYEKKLNRQTTKKKRQITQQAKGLHTHAYQFVTCSEDMLRNLQNVTNMYCGIKFHNSSSRYWTLMTFMLVKGPLTLW